MLGDVARDASMDAFSGVQVLPLPFISILIQIIVVHGSVVVGSPAAIHTSRRVVLALAVHRFLRDRLVGVSLVLVRFIPPRMLLCEIHATSRLIADRVPHQTQFTFFLLDLRVTVLGGLTVEVELVEHFAHAAP